MGNNKKPLHSKAEGQGEDSMKLNPNCVRDAMLVLEEELHFNIEKSAGKEVYVFKGISLTRLAEELGRRGYPKEDAAYAVLQIFESKYIVTSRLSPINDRRNWIELGNILYITPAGHTFISSVSDEHRWKNKIIPIVDKVGNVSLSVIEAIAKGVTNAFIENMIHFSDISGTGLNT